MTLDQPAITEQLPLFEDKRVLLNRGILELTKLNLSEAKKAFEDYKALYRRCLLYTSPSPRDRTRSRMPSSA